MQELHAGAKLRHGSQAGFHVPCPLKFIPEKLLLICIPEYCSVPIIPPRPSLFGSKIRPAI
jgi:hypothetical protein